MGHTVDKGDLALPDAASDATVKEKLQEDTKTLREEIDESIERLVSTGKIPSAELLRIVQGLQEGTAIIKVEELGQGLATTDDKMEKLRLSLLDTDDKVKQLEHEINSQMTKGEHILGSEKSVMGFVNDRTTCNCLHILPSDFSSLLCLYS